MVHFNHPRELTTQAIRATHLLIKAGAITANQTPLLKGINDDPLILANLQHKLSFIGIAPYYVFQGRPTAGNQMFAIPLEQSFDSFELARMYCSGLAKRARFIMSHALGKIEMVGKTETQVFFRYHRAANPQKKARFMIYERNPNAFWYDDYNEIVEEYSIDNPYRCFGPD